MCSRGGVQMEIEKKEVSILRECKNTSQLVNIKICIIKLFQCGFCCKSNYLTSTNNIKVCNNINQSKTNKIIENDHGLLKKNTYNDKIKMIEHIQNDKINESEKVMKTDDIKEYNEYEQKNIDDIEISTENSNEYNNYDKTYIKSEILCDVENISYINDDILRSSGDISVMKNNSIARIEPPDKCSISILPSPTTKISFSVSEFIIIDANYID